MLRANLSNTAFQIKRSMSSVGAKDFEGAVSLLATLKNQPDNTTKLKIYALFKQASKGECTAGKPGMLDMVGKAKWSAWKELGAMSQEDAKNNYTSLINELAAVETPSSSSSSPSSGVDGDLLSIVEGKIHKIVFNRPDKKNAIKKEMYIAFMDALKEAANNDTSIAVVTGKGNYYSSGNDLSNLAEIDLNNVAEEARKGGELLRDFVTSLIDFPKPLIALVNGPSVGIPTTTLGLFDAVYASDKATFHTPFSQLGQSPEGCSSYTFPLILGPALATEMLLFNKKISAQRAMEAGLVSEVFPDGTFEKEAWERLKQLSLLPPQSLRISKNLIRDTNRATYHEVNKRECVDLVERWQSDECKNAVFEFFKSKL